VEKCPLTTYRKSGQWPQGFRIKYFPGYDACLAAEFTQITWKQGEECEKSQKAADRKSGLGF
jgi:hypothetical protein